MILEKLRYAIEHWKYSYFCIIVYCISSNETNFGIKSPITILYAIKLKHQTGTKSFNLEDYLFQFFGVYLFIGDIAWRIVTRRWHIQ